MQKRVRSVLLEALHAWQVSQYDCHAIEHVLEYIHEKINKFEESAGEIRGAAAGKVWWTIKHVVDDLLSAGSGPGHLEIQDAESVAPLEKSARLVKRRLERQSGIQGLSWDASLQRWSLYTWEDGKRKWFRFSIVTRTWSGPLFPFYWGWGSLIVPLNPKRAPCLFLGYCWV